MEKQIRKILLMLKSTLVAIWIILVVLILLGEMGLYMDWAVMPQSEEEFVLNSVAICLTLLGIPLSVKFYNLCTQHSLRRMDNDEALSSYLTHGIVRNVMFLVIIVFDIIIYYLTGSIAGALCALCASVVSVFCWPKRSQIDEYLEKVNQDD